MQIPQRLDRADRDQGAAARYLDELGRPLAITELTKERIRRAARKISADNLLVKLDAGFRVLKLAQSNIRPWNPELSDLEGTLLANAEHLVPGRTEADILTELLLKLGLDLCVPIETKDIAGKSVHSVGAGALIVCLSDGINRDNAERAYNLIMKEKEKLLSFDTKLKFIFSHSALKEGWDNPNVFQICTLRDIGTERERRQTIGRGLRLAVKSKGEDKGHRVRGFEINTLTVIATESYEEFADRVARRLLARCASCSRRLSRPGTVREVLP